MASLGQLLPAGSTARAVADAQGPGGQAVQTRAALNFMLSKDGEFFREFILDEVTVSSTGLVLVQNHTCNDSVRFSMCVVSVRHPWDVSRWLLGLHLFHLFRADQALRFEIETLG